MCLSTRPPDANSKIQKCTGVFHSQMTRGRLWWYLCLKVKAKYGQRRPRHETRIWSSKILDSKILDSKITLFWPMPSDNLRLEVWCLSTRHLGQSFCSWDNLGLNYVNIVIQKSGCHSPETREEREPKFQKQVPSSILAVRWSNFAAEFLHFISSAWAAKLSATYGASRLAEGCSLSGEQAVILAPFPPCLGHIESRINEQYTRYVFNET